jgi:hypothetical protein
VLRNKELQPAGIVAYFRVKIIEIWLILTSVPPPLWEGRRVAVRPDFNNFNPKISNNSSWL